MHILLPREPCVAIIFTGKLRIIDNFECNSLHKNREYEVLIKLSKNFTLKKLYKRTSTIISDNTDINADITPQNISSIMFCISHKICINICYKNLFGS